jgi:hypothetical protein
MLASRSIIAIECEGEAHAVDPPGMAIDGRDAGGTDPSVATIGRLRLVDGVLLRNGVVWWWFPSGGAASIRRAWRRQGAAARSRASFVVIFRHGFEPVTEAPYAMKAQKDQDEG